MKFLFQLLLFSFFFSLTYTNAQNEQAIDSLLDLGFDLNQQDLDSAISLEEKALKQSKQIKYEYGIANSYARLGISYRFKGLYDQAILYSDTSLSMAEGFPRIQASALNNKGVCYRFKGNMEVALNNYLAAIKIYEDRKDTVEIATIYNSIGVMFMYSDFPEKAFQYYDKAEALQTKLGNLKGSADVFNNYAILYANSGDLDKSLDYFNRSLQIETKLENKRGMIESYGNIGLVYFMQGKVDKAIEITNRSIAIEKEMGNVQGEIASLNSIAEMYSEVGRTDEALEVLDKVLTVALKIDSKDDIAVAYLNLSKLYDKLGDFEKAYQNFFLFHQVEDSSKSESQQRLLAELETKYQTEKKEKQIAFQEVELANQKTKLLARQQYITALVAIIVLVLVLSALFYQAYKRKKEKELQLAIIEEQQKGIEAVFNAQEEERKRISKDLHDGVGQKLSGLKMAFQKIKGELKEETSAKQEELNKLSLILNDTADEVRSISHQMMPKALTELGLIEAIEDMLNKSLGNTQIEYEFEHFGLKGRVEERIEISLYRIAQELINNVIKHSKAQKVQFQLFKNKDKLIMIVEDNGVGIEGKKINDGHGLLNIKSRLDTIKGEVNYEPSPNSGTIATIRVPLK